MKKLLSIILCCIIVFSLVGCGAVEPAVFVNVDGQSDLNNNVLGADALIEIGNGLWYDTTTRIVYWWNGVLGKYNYAITPSPYYAPNGLPYLYNPKTNTFEEIN